MCVVTLFLLPSSSFRYAEQEGHGNGGVVTAYELFFQDNAPFIGMPEKMYMRVLGLLCDAGMVALIPRETHKELGIKFA